VTPLSAEWDDPAESHKTFADYWGRSPAIYIAPRTILRRLWRRLTDPLVIAFFFSNPNNRFSNAMLTAPKASDVAAGGPPKK
jgi:hypothetical protein